MKNRASIIKNFLDYIKSKSIHLPIDEEAERELIGEFAANISINNKENFPKLFEAFITDIKDNKSFFSIVDENGFAGYQESPVTSLLKRNIECKIGTIFFIIMFGDEKEFIPWGEQPVSKNLIDQITLYYNEELDNIHGWLGDRCIEYGKFKDGDKIIERINDILNIYFKKKKKNYTLHLSLPNSEDK
jgi:hypothetical protein